MDLFQKEQQKKAAEKVNRPTPIVGLTKSTTYSSRLYDPTLTVREDIKDLKGKMIAKKGDTYNPLDIVSFGLPLLFINGDEETEVQWALSQKGKIVLINGAPLELEKHHAPRLFFFDQGGVLVEKFGLTETPARVSQQGKHLLIEAMPLLKGKSE